MLVWGRQGTARRRVTKKPRKTAHYPNYGVDFVEIHTSKLIQLHTLNQCGSSYVNYILIKGLTKKPMQTNDREFQTKQLRNPGCQSGVFVQLTSSRWSEESQVLTTSLLTSEGPGFIICEMRATTSHSATFLERVTVKTESDDAREGGLRTAARRAGADSGRSRDGPPARESCPARTLHASSIPNPPKMKSNSPCKCLEEQ